MSLFGLSLIPGVFGILTGIVCLLRLRSYSLSGDRKRDELVSMLRQHRDECSEQFAQLGRSIGVMELSARSMEEAGRGLTRSRRSQALQLLRSGMSPESAASSLGIAKREMRLIARVSRILPIQ